VAERFDTGQLQQSPPVPSESDGRVRGLRSDRQSRLITAKLRPDPKRPR